MDGFLKNKAKWMTVHYSPGPFNFKLTPISTRPSFFPQLPTWKTVHLEPDLVLRPVFKESGSKWTVIELEVDGPASKTFAGIEVTELQTVQMKSFGSSSLISTDRLLWPKTVRFCLGPLKGVLTLPLSLFMFFEGNALWRWRINRWNWNSRISRFCPFSQSSMNVQLWFCHSDGENW